MHCYVRVPDIDERLFCLFCFGAGTVMIQLTVQDKDWAFHLTDKFRGWIVKMLLVSR